MFGYPFLGMPVSNYLSICLIDLLTLLGDTRTQSYIMVLNSIALYS